MSQFLNNKLVAGIALIATIFICLIARPYYMKKPTDILQLLEQQKHPPPQPRETVVKTIRDYIPSRPVEILEDERTSSSSSSVNMVNARIQSSSSSDESGWESSKDLDGSASSWQDILEASSIDDDGEDEEGDIVSEHNTLHNDSTIDETKRCPERKPVSTKQRIPKELYNLAPEVFDFIPSKFIPGYRSPCWNGKDKGRALHCLPSFFLAGIPKSGTTDLWSKIEAHRDVLKVRKEPQWWTRRRFSYIQNMKGKKVVYKYTNHYSRIADAIHHNSSRSRRLIVGDGSASTFWDNGPWQDYFPIDLCKNGPPYLIADVIHYVLPNAKILVMLRNPTDRLYSDYIYFGRGKVRTETSFHHDVVETIKIFNMCTTDSSRRACAYALGLYYRPEVRLQVGLYSIYVRDWLKIFPRDQLLFLRLEDWHTLCPKILPKVHDFLELVPQTKHKILDTCSSKVANPTLTKRASMLNKTRQILDEFYASTRSELADLLHDEAFLWK